MPSKMIRVLVVEDVAVIFAATKAVLQKCGDIEVIGHAADGERAVRMAETLRPDVVLMDISLPHTNGIQATARIKDMLPNTKIIMLTHNRTPEDVIAALAAGADAYCLKDAATRVVDLAVRAVASGATWLDRSIAPLLLQAFSGETKQAPTAVLTRREREVLQLMANGLSNREIGLQLDVSVETVKTHVRNIMNKLRVNDRTPAVIKAIRQGLVQH